MFLSLAFVVGMSLAQPVLVVRETTGGPTHIFLDRSDVSFEIGKYPTVGGHLPFVTDLSVSCRVLFLETADDQYRLVRAEISEKSGLSGNRVLVVSTTPLSSPRWSPTGDRVAVVEAAPANFRSSISVLTKDGRSLFRVEGTQFTWLSNETMLVHVLPNGAKRKCQEVLLVGRDGAVVRSIPACRAENAWLPSWGFAPPNTPPVMFRDSGDNLELFWIDREGNERSHVTAQPLESPAMQAVACETGISLGTKPGLSLIRDGNTWRFSESDTCNIGRIQELVTERQKRDKSITRRLIYCADRSREKH